LTYSTKSDEIFGDYVSQVKAARILGVTKQAITYLVRQGYLTTKAIAGLTFVLRSDVEFLAARSKGRPSKQIHAKENRSKKSVAGIGPKNLEKYATQAEAARIRGVSQQAIANLIRRGKLLAVAVAGRTLVLRSEVEAFVPQSKPGLSPKKAASKVSAKAKSSKS
jgi:plasmid maintenance system antidote protein VapI